eukprot:2264189-Pyramimonas_sp.AAC.1
MAPLGEGRQTIEDGEGVSWGRGTPINSWSDSERSAWLSSRFGGGALSTTELELGPADPVAQPRRAC